MNPSPDVKYLYLEKNLANSSSFFTPQDPRLTAVELHTKILESMKQVINIIHVKMQWKLKNNEFYFERHHDCVLK